MKTDVKGCSTCAPGEEHFEFYISRMDRKVKVQYDYRKPDGRLFSCVVTSLEAARAKRDAWLSGVAK